jgi:hypothetical protein
MQDPRMGLLAVDPASGARVSCQQRDANIVRLGAVLAFGGDGSRVWIVDVLLTPSGTRTLNAGHGRREKVKNVPDEHRIKHALRMAFWLKLRMLRKGFPLGDPLLAAWYTHGA